MGFTLRSVNIELVGTGANQPERQPLIRVNPQQPGCHSQSFFLKRALFTFIISLISFIGQYLTERHIMIFIVRVKLGISKREREKDLFYFSYLSYLITLSWSLVPISG